MFTKGFFTTIWEIELAVACEERKENVTQKQLAEQSGISLSNFKYHLSLGRKQILELEKNSINLVVIKPNTRVTNWYRGFSEKHKEAIQAIVKKFGD